MLSHAAVRPFQCPHCPYRAALKYNLDAHIRLKHPEEAQSVQRNRDPGFTSGNLTGSVAQGALQQQSCETSDNGNSFIQVE